MKGYNISDMLCILGDVCPSAFYYLMKIKQKILTHRQTRITTKIAVKMAVCMTVALVVSLLSSPLSLLTVVGIYHKYSETFTDSIYLKIYHIYSNICIEGGGGGWGWGWFAIHYY